MKVSMAYYRLLVLFKADRQLGSCGCRGRSDLDTEDKTPDQEDNMKREQRKRKQCTEPFYGLPDVCSKHKRMNYMEKKMRIKEYENESQDSLQKSCTDFQEEYHRYLIEQSPWSYAAAPNVDELVKALDETKLIRAILELKNGTRIFLIARVFQEQDFASIGRELGMTEKQAEMAHYYIVRKIRKELEGKKYEWIWDDFKPCKDGG